MSNFSNNEYRQTVTDLIGDMFYKNTSVSGKISFVRKYAEVVIRKILDIEPNDKVTLGAGDIQKRIKTLPNHEFIEAAVKTICRKGNDSIHTQYLGGFNSEDFDEVMDSLFDMLSFLFINYFEKYEFGSRNTIVSAFSLLPPIIRYKVLRFLNKKYPNNIAVIDKLVLATMKAISVEEAEKWVEEQKDILTNMKAMSEKAFDEIAEQRGAEIAKSLWDLAPNMYQLSKEKISLVGTNIKTNGLVYSDFETALPYYKAKGTLIGTEPEIEEFNDIMHFLYLGRKEKINELSNECNSYVIFCFTS